MGKLLTACLLIAACCCPAAEKIRVASFSPCLTEIVFKLGKGGCLVGRSSACDYPPEASSVPVVGQFGDPSLETLLRLKPDLAVSSTLKNPSVSKSVENAGTRFLVLPTDSVDDYCRTVETLGRELGCEDAAELEVARIRGGLAKFREEAAKIPPESRRRVYLEVWNSPFMTVGRRSFLNDFIECAGGVNIARGEDRDYFTCSAEWIIRANPDVVIAPAMGKGSAPEIMGRPGWKNIAAVRERRIFVNLNQDLVYRLGPRMLEGIELLRDCVSGGGGGR